jgi:hypothetical protein
MPFLNVRTGRVWGTVFDRCTAENFDIALALRLENSDVKDARQVFLILDNGSSHHPNTSPKRIQSLFPQVTTVHLPIHASWLNQVEIYNSIIKRKALRPADFASVAEVERRIYAFEQYYNCFAEPFGWKYGREDLTHFRQFPERIGPCSCLYRGDFARVSGGL